MKYLFITFFAITIPDIKAESIQNKIKDYFNNDVVKSFEKKWNTYAFTYENAIAYSLKEDYGHKSMNVYVNRFQKLLWIASGYYHTDNQVKLVFGDMRLESLPHLYDVDISFPLASNVVQVGASVSKMILHSPYILFRNLSDIIYSPADQDPYKNSPFRFQQVRNIGELAISIEGCSLSGVIVATLSGNSVNLGHHELKLQDCQYSIEIYKLGSGTPPVIANYLPKGGKGLNIENLLSRPMLEELVPKLQGAMFSQVNTLAIFSNDLPNIRSKQEALFDRTKNWIDTLVRDMNQKSIEKNMGTIDLEDFHISWDDTFTELPLAKSIKLSKITLLGLDTVYASHAGGPVRLTETEIMEQLRFSTLQVIGKISIDTIQDDSEFAVEISDLAVNVYMDLNLKIKFEVSGWRFLEFSCPDLEFLTTEPLVVGYLMNEVPKHIKSHLESVYDGKVSINQEYVEQPIDGSQHIDTKEIFDQQLLNQELDEGHVKLHHLEVKSHDEEQEIVKLNDTQSEELFKDDEHIVEAKPHKEDDRTPDKNLGRKMPKKAARKNLNLNGKMLTKPNYKVLKQVKYERVNRRTNKLSTKTRKSIHTSDNEIQLN